MKLVGYMRVLTAHQSPEQAFEDHEKRLSEYCMAAGHDLVAHGETAGGNNLGERPGLYMALGQCMLDPDCDGLIVVDLGELSQNMQDLKLILNVLAVNNRQFIAINQGIDTSDPESQSPSRLEAHFQRLEENKVVPIGLKNRGS